MNRKLLLFVLLLTIAAAFFASTHPDGLDKTAERLGFAPHGVERGAIFAGYAVPGWVEGSCSTALAGIFGVLITLAIFWLAVRLGQRFK
jgi:cobalt/nickel transport protein